MTISLTDRLLLLLLILLFPLAAKGQWEFGPWDYGYLTVYYDGPGGAVVIPEFTNGCWVARIGSYAFNGAAVTSITAPASIQVRRALCIRWLPNSHERHLPRELPV